MTHTHTLFYSIQLCLLYANISHIVDCISHKKNIHYCCKESSGVFLHLFSLLLFCYCCCLFSATQRLHHDTHTHYTSRLERKSVTLAVSRWLSSIRYELNWKMKRGLARKRRREMPDALYFGRLQYSGEGKHDRKCHRTCVCEPNREGDKQQRSREEQQQQRLQQQ